MAIISELAITAYENNERSNCAYFSVNNWNLVFLSVCNNMCNLAWEGNIIHVLWQTIPSAFDSRKSDPQSLTQIE